ncbi:MAG: hypothetical protein JO372_13180, partial [Solirubrobacterales bacterium]|nr:hypothetical protein [Solirubrobacterales bacterium]
MTIRTALAGDGERLAEIFYQAFESIAQAHGFPVEPPSREFTYFRVLEMLTSDGYAGFVVEHDGELLGSAFIDERSLIAGVGPVTVDP